MGLAEVSQFRSPYLSVKETVQFWEVSERTLRRRLASGAPGCYRDDSGQWCLSVHWVDEEFHRRRITHPLLAQSAPYQHQDNIVSDTEPITSRAPGSPITAEVNQSSDPISDDWIRELLETERRATKAETELELVKVQLDQLRHELQSAKGDLNYERSLVNRLKDQLRGDG